MHQKCSAHHNRVLHHALLCNTFAPQTPADHNDTLHHDSLGTSHHASSSGQHSCTPNRLQTFADIRFDMSVVAYQRLPLRVAVTTRCT
jgi:hypothetical protein